MDCVLPGVRCTQPSATWSGSHQPFSPPAYARHLLTKEQIFPMSFGFDNEVLLSTVYHPCWPLAEQIGADEDTRRLPS